MHSRTSRPLDQWFARYSADHRNAINQKIHLFAVPAILWSVIALLWCIPVFGLWMKTGIWSALAMFAAWMFYNRLSRALGLGMLGLLVSLAWMTRWLEAALGAQRLFWLALTVFALAWIAQFIGHRIEGRKPSFFTDLTYLLIGPGWVLAKVYRVMGWRY